MRTKECVGIKQNSTTKKTIEVPATERLGNIIYNKLTRCNSGSIVFIKNNKYALHVS